VRIFEDTKIPGVETSRLLPGQFDVKICELPGGIMIYIPTYCTTEIYRVSIKSNSMQLLLIVQ